MNTSSMTEADWAAILDEAASPATATPAAAPPPVPLKTADDILREEQAKADLHHVETTTGGAATVPRASGTPTQAAPPTTGSGIVFADQTPAATPTSVSDSPELIELGAIRRELEALIGFVAVAINKLPPRR